MAFYRLALVSGLVASSCFVGVCWADSVGISGTAFTINGSVTYPGTSIEGLLMNSRMINAVFDDENPSTAGMWAYPDTGVWDPQRNTNGFIAALPSYAAKGLKAFTLGLQGGKPVATDAIPKPHPWIVTAFNPDGSLKPAWLNRADQVIRAADRNGLVVILQYFYQHQEDRFIDDNAVLAAVDNATDWVLSQGYTNVLIEIANESDTDYRRTILRPENIHQVIARVQARSNGRLKVSASVHSGDIPPDAFLRQADFILLHGNAQSVDNIRSYVDAIRATSAYQSQPKPIIFNEDTPNITKLNAAVEKGASWGYYDGSGFQYVPANWTINTPTKQAFFDRVAELAGGSAPALQADLSVTKTDSPDPVIGGSDVTYTVNVTNNGPIDATGIVLTDNLPASVLFGSASPSCTELSGAVTCNIGNLASGGSTPIEIVVSPTADGVITNTATVTGVETDSNTVNNSATAETTVNTAGVSMTDLSVTKADSPDPVIVGNSLTYTVMVANNGPNAATGITLTDTLPAGATFGSASPGCSASGGVVVCNIGDLAGGASSAPVNITITPNAPGSISNTAQVSGNENDPAIVNNTDTEQTTVNAVSAVPTCNGLIPTKVGTAGNNTINGTSAADVIHGLGGNDVIYGKGANDIICGGDGNDRLDGAGGNDQLFGEIGGDRLIGAAGSDALDGGADVDTCSGGLPPTGDSATNCEQQTGIP